MRRREPEGRHAPQQLPPARSNTARRRTTRPGWEHRDAWATAGDDCVVGGGMQRGCASGWLRAGKLHRLLQLVWAMCERHRTGSLWLVGLGLFELHALGAHLSAGAVRSIVQRRRWFGRRLGERGRDVGRWLGAGGWNVGRGWWCLGRWLRHGRRLERCVRAVDLPRLLRCRSMSARCVRHRVRHQRRRVWRVQRRSLRGSPQDDGRWLAGWPVQLRGGRRLGHVHGRL